MLLPDTLGVTKGREGSARYLLLLAAVNVDMSQLVMWTSQGCEYEHVSAVNMNMSQL